VHELETSAPQVAFTVVGIGGSAGGFEAVMKLVRLLPANTGMAFVCVMHLDPHHTSKLSELFGRATGMPVVEIRDSMRVEPNTIHVLPPNFDVILSDKHLRLVRRPATERLHLPIDHFFESLAIEQGPRSIGVVLSGTGSDGTQGLGTMKAEGGITFAESEESAKYFEMPRSAIESGCVDTVLPVEQIAAELARIARHPLVRGGKGEKGRITEAFPEASDALAKIFFLLRQHSAVDFSLYKPTTLRRRINRRMVLQRIEKLDDYVKMVRSDKEELEALFHDLLINVTGFFRDKNVFTALKKRVIPKLIKSRGPANELRVWVAGCATGEEVYSLAICLTEELSRHTRQVKLQFFGSDLSELAVSRARAGIYPATIEKDVSPVRLRRFFTKVNGGYQISRSIRDMCTFARQNLVEDPPFSRIDVISCRNVLIYLGPELQKKCMPVFHYALNPGGFLILGTSETVGTAIDLFTVVDKKNKIYGKKDGHLSASRLDFSTRGFKGMRVLSEEKRPREDSHELHPVPAALDLRAQTDRIILDRYSPAGVVIDRNMRVHEFRGRTGRFIEHSPGTASLNLLQMVRPSLMVDLRTAIHKAIKTQAPVHKEGVPMKVATGTPQEATIDVIPFGSINSPDAWLLVLFREQPMPNAELPSAKPGRKGGKSDARREEEVNHLRTELDATKESLQAIIEEQEATNEELKSANEEIESSNEELQSTNEELETAKEELQSTNEELNTLNEELSHRNAEMTKMNDDLSNLLSSISIPIIMVDNGLAVRRATPMAEKLFNLIPTDIGRRLSDMKANLNVTDLDKSIRAVLDMLTPRDAKVQDTEGHWYSLRIRPYRTRDNKIDGAVVTLLDIDREQRTIEQLEGTNQYHDALFDTVREPLLVLDDELRVHRASQTFYDAFDLKPKKVDGQKIYEIGDTEWDIPALHRLLEETLPKSKRVEAARVQIEFPKLGPRTLLVNARHIDTNGIRRIVLAIEDITDDARGLPAKSARS
jgi:two-component system CheB/CheR fusion protein